MDADLLGVSGPARAVEGQGRGSRLTLASLTDEALTASMLVVDELMRLGGRTLTQMEELEKLRAEARRRDEVDALEKAWTA